MADPRHIDDLLQEWPYRASRICARLVRASSGRNVLQMRVDLGLLQMEVIDRPDGWRPHGFDTYLDYLKESAEEDLEAFSLTEDHYVEVDREFLQYYHRRICWLELREFRRAAMDADHTLELMNFVQDHAEDADWVVAHEQYRPFVLFHRTQAMAMAELEDEGPEAAVEVLHDGLQTFRRLYEEHEAAEQFDEDEFVVRLVDLRDSIRDHFEVGPTLRERLSDAIATEQYELAARLRDEIARREIGPN